MWNPPDKDALPSLKERKSAEEAIRELENILEEAVEAMEQAQLRVLMLRRELDSRRAWLAPIRKLPVEILSRIFTLNSEMKALAPVRITEVCRFWRQIVLSTPSAWLLIYLGSRTPCKDVVSYTSTYLARSDPCLLHMWIPQDLYSIPQDLSSILQDLSMDEQEEEEGEGEEEEEEDRTHIEELKDQPLFSSLISAYSYRFKCLSITGSQLAQSEEIFPNLTNLFIEGSNSDTSPRIDLSRFPRLSSLYTSDCFLADPVGARYPLQCLTIWTDSSQIWIKVIQACSNTLMALSVEAWADKVTTRIVIDLPTLKFLRFRTNGTTFQAITPALVTYEEILRRGPPLDTPHTNVQRVTHIRTSSILNLAEYSSLRLLQLVVLWPSEEAIIKLVVEMVKLLVKDPDICSALETIEIYEGNLKSDPLQAKIEVEEAIRKCGLRPNITINYMNQLTFMPGSPEITHCDTDIPCMSRGCPLWMLMDDAFD